MATPSERVAKVEQRLTDHESRCEERLGEIKKAIGGLQNRSWALVIAVLAWAVSQLWITQQARIERIEQQKPALASTR